MDSKLIFAYNLRRIMKDRGLKQTDIATVTNSAQTTVSDWMCAKKYPKMDKIQMIADYLGIPKMELIEEPELKKLKPEIAADVYKSNGDLCKEETIEVPDEVINRYLSILKRHPGVDLLIASVDDMTDEEIDTLTVIARLTKRK